MSRICRESAAMNLSFMLEDRAARGLKRFGHDRARQEALLAGQLKVGFTLRGLLPNSYKNDAHQQDEQHEGAQHCQIGSGKPFQN